MFGEELLESVIGSCEREIRVRGATQETNQQ